MAPRNMILVDHCDAENEPAAICHLLRIWTPSARAREIGEDSGLIATD